MPSINRCNDLNNNKTDSTSTCEHLRPLQCAEMYPEVLAGTIAAVLDYNESPTNVPVKSKLKHPPGQPPGHLNFWKILFKFPPPQAEKLFKCPIIGPFQVIKCPHPRETFPSSFYYAPEAVYVNMV